MYRSSSSMRKSGQRPASESLPLASDHAPETAQGKRSSPRDEVLCRRRPWEQRQHVLTMVARPFSARRVDQDDLQMHKMV